MNPKEQIIKSLIKITGTKNIQLDVPEKEEFGDCSSNIAMQLFAEIKNQRLRVKSSKEREKNAICHIPYTIYREYKSPYTLASSIVDALKKDAELMKIVDKIEVAGGGFINFHLSRTVLVRMLEKALGNDGKYGKSTAGKGKTVVIDYSSPNIAKPFGIGHLRSTIIGQSLYNIYSFLGYKVIGDNHLGDWGTQFGKLLYMIDKVHKGNPPGNMTVEDLEQLYIEFHQQAKNNSQMEDEARVWFKKLEDGDEVARRLWKYCLDISMLEYDKIYKLLGVQIDYAYGESAYEDEMKRMITDFKKGKLKGLEEGEEGSKIIELRDYGIKVPLMFLKSDGTTTYATRDLACIRFRIKKWNPDIFIYEVGVQQTLHFQQVFAAAQKIGLISDDKIMHHTKHGWYLGSDGKKFSTREGKTVKLIDVLNEAIERAKKLGCTDDKTAKKVGIGAIIYNDLMRSVQTDVVFDWEKIMNMNGNSGPYIQYTYARTCSVLAKFKSQNSKVKNIDENNNLPNKWKMENARPEQNGSGGKWKMNSGEISLLRTLIHFPEVVQQAGERFAPNLICEYLFNLAQKFNTFYNAQKILTDDQVTQNFRLALTGAVGIILKDGLSLLGIQSPQKM